MLLKAGRKLSPFFDNTANYYHVLSWLFSLFAVSTLPNSLQLKVPTENFNLSLEQKQLKQCLY